MLTSLGNISAHASVRLPAFSVLLVGLRPWFLLMPIPVAGYCLYALFRRSQTEQGSAAFLACTMGALCLMFFPVLMALFLPCFALLQQAR